MKANCYQCPVCGRTELSTDGIPVCKEGHHAESMTVNKCQEKKLRSLGDNMETLEEIKMERIIREAMETMDAYLVVQELTNTQMMIAMYTISSTLSCGVISDCKGVTVESFTDTVRLGVEKIERDKAADQMQAKTDCDYWDRVSAETTKDMPITKGIRRIQGANIPKTYIVQLEARVWLSDNESLRTLNKCHARKFETFDDANAGLFSARCITKKGFYNARIVEVVE